MPIMTTICCWLIILRLKFFNWFEVKPLFLIHLYYSPIFDIFDAYFRKTHGGLFGSVLTIFLPYFDRAQVAENLFNWILVIQLIKLSLLNFKENLIFYDLTPFRAIFTIDRIKAAIESFKSFTVYRFSVVFFLKKINHNFDSHACGISCF